MDAVGLSPAEFRRRAEVSLEKLPALTDPEVFADKSGLRRSGFLRLFYRINPHVLDQKLQASLDWDVVGYCYMIRHEGQIVHFRSAGWAQTPDDAGIHWTFSIPMDVASVSKFITAIVVMQLLRHHRLPVTTPIGAWLPHYWPKGAGSSNLTFRDLLRHESRLGSTMAGNGDGTFPIAKAEIAAGPAAFQTGYKNVNYIILRVLIATLSGRIAPAFQFPPVPFGPLAGLNLVREIQTDVFWDVVSTAAYADCVNDGVFAPANILPRDFKAPEDAAKGYIFPPVAPGFRHEDTSTWAGTGGWHLSNGELSRLLADFRAGKIVPSSIVNQMLTDMLGVDTTFPCRAGVIRHKGGRAAGAPRVLDTGIYFMPGGLELAIFVNSLRANGSGALAAIPQLIEDSTELFFLGRV